ncbi:MAG: vanadium-dependent haloperoxidase [Bacteroidota bacterium]
MRKTISIFQQNRLAAFLVLFIALMYSCRKEDKVLLPASRDPQLFGVKAEKESSAVATDWYRLQTRIMLERNSAFNGTYFSYIGIGLYEAIRPGIKGAASFSSKLNKMPAMPQPQNNQGYSWQVSANAALAAMVRSFFTGLTPANMASIDSLEAVYNEKSNPAMQSEVFRRSQAFGRSIATAMHNWFLTDDLNPTNIGYVLPPSFPGSWQPTPPAFGPIPINPFVQNATPLLIEDVTALCEPFPLEYSETPGSAFYNMQKQVYDQSFANTPAQKAIALHWVDQGSGVGYTPAGHDFLVITQAFEQLGLNLAIVAEAYAKAGIAQRETTIVTFRSKYANFILRPVTYIQKVIDPNWLPLFPTPPHPEYPAAHAMVTGTVMQATARVIGNNHTVADHSYVFRGYPVQTYSSIFGAAEQAGISRNYGGIHYLISITEGLRMAKILGNRVGDIQLHE